MATYKERLEEKNTSLVLKAFDTLFNRRDGKAVKTVIGNIFLLDTYLQGNGLTKMLAGMSRNILVL